MGAFQLQESYDRLKQAFERFDSGLRLHRFGIRYFRPKIHIYLERGDFIIKTVTDRFELEECLRLRFDVFYKEFQGDGRLYGVDVDDLDLVSDHLAIIDTKKEKIVGTYRMNSSRFSEAFYSASEFRIDRLVDLPGNKLELGRACIEPGSRTGAVMALLWRGISDYIRATESEHLFGCASVKTTDKFTAAMMYIWLRENGFVDNRYGVRPTLKYQFSFFEDCVNEIDAAKNRYDLAAIQAQIPPLLHSYLRMGAKVCGFPALDRDFGCIDFLTLLEMNQMEEAFARKYRD